MDNQLDPQALALAKAIRRTETGGHKDPYNARGASGEFGAFQFMPATYKSLAQKHLGNANAAPTVENQNKIVYSEIKKLKDQGYNPAQIASIWNSGNPDRYKNGGVGVNKYGVSYNVPQYVSKVSQNYKALIGTVQPVQQQAPEQPVEPTIEQQKQERIAQGLPVSVREDRAEPTAVGSFIRGAVKPFVSAATTVVPAVRSITEGSQPFEQTYRPVKTNYLGDVYSPGAKGIVGLEQAKTVGDVAKSTTQATADIAGKGIEIGSYGMGGSTIAGLKGIPAIKQGIVEGAKLGAVGGFGSGLQAGAEQDTLGGALGQVALQTGAGAAIGGVLGGATTGIAKGGQNFVNRNKPEVISSKIDNEIANIFKGTTGDIDKIRESSFKARKGIELLQKESPNIKIPDEKAPLGTRETKSFNPAIAKPNELLSGVKEMDNLIVSKMKKATEDARSRGFEVNTNDAKLIIRDAIDNGDIPKASGERMLKQIDSIGNDPVKAHDWVQDVNMKYKKKYERGTIEDTAVGSLADDVAQVLRDNLDLIVDRKGYAEAYGNNQELKRMLVAIAKKANKQVNWGDITTDAGLDAAISILTGNPAYMARTVATSVFKNIWNKFRNNAGLRSFRSAVKGTAKVGTETRLPYSVAKPQFKSKNLLQEGKGFENKAGIQLGKPKVTTTFEPRAKVVNTQPRAKQLGLPAPKNVIELPKNITKTTLGSDVTENAIIRNPNDRRKLINKPKTRIISEESYKKALKNLGDTSTLNSTPIHLSKDALIVAGYHIENGVRSAAELGIELAKKGYKFTKEQLEELFNKANKNVEIEPLIQEAKKYKSAEEFVKAQPKLYHGGRADIKDIQLGKSNFQKTFYMSENPDYAKSFGGNKSSLNEIMVDSKAKLADLRKPSDDLVKQIEDIISSKPTGKTVRIQKPDGTFLEIPETKSGLSNPVHSSKDILNGIRQGKAYFAEMPEVKNALKKLGYDGMITQESKMGTNFGVWNKDILKTKSQLEDIWKKANKK